MEFKLKGRGSPRGKEKLKINKRNKRFKGLESFFYPWSIFNVFKKSLKGERGVALLMAVSFLVVMSFLVMEAARETVTEYSISSRKVNKIKSYYAAKAGMKFALLRLNLYTTLLKQYHAQVNPQNIHQVNEIWKMPFNWPLSTSLPGEVSQSIKKSLKDMEEKSFLKANFSLTIEPQSTSIDINNLGSAASNLSKAARLFILSIFNKELSENKAFAERYKEFNFDQLVNNIADWVDHDKSSRNDGRNEFVEYDLNERLHNKEFMPPHQSFKILSELHMVKGMKDDFYNLLVPHITLYGDMGFNVNMPENINRLLEYRIFKKETVEKIQDHLFSEGGEGGFFSSPKEFKDFLKQEGIQDEVTGEGERAEGDENAIPLNGFPFSFGFENFFRIISNGEYKGVSTQIIVHTSDLNLNRKSLKSHLDYMDSLAQGDQGSSSENETSNQNQNSEQNNTSTNQGSPNGGPRPLPTTGIPTIVYWREI